MKLIVAADKNWGIGKDGGLLCHLPGDLKYFKQKTTGKTVVMGRRTLESMPGGKPLPNRENVVLTRDASFAAEGCRVAHSKEELLREYGGDDVFVIGGGEVYSQLLPYCDTCFVTKIDKAFDADVYMPDLDSDGSFDLAELGPVCEENGVSYRFAVYKRK